MTDLSADSISTEVRRRKLADHRERSFRIALSLLAAAVVVVGTLTFGYRQSQYHHDQSITNARITCEIATLNSILGELAAAQSAEVHGQRPPVFRYPLPC